MLLAYGVLSCAADANTIGCIAGVGKSRVGPCYRFVTACRITKSLHRLGLCCSDYRCCKHRLWTDIRCYTSPDLVSFEFAALRSLTSLSVPYTSRCFSHMVWFVPLGLPCWQDYKHSISPSISCTPFLLNTVDIYSHMAMPAYALRLSLHCQLLPQKNS